MSNETHAMVIVSLTFVAFLLLSSTVMAWDYASPLSKVVKKSTAHALVTNATGAGASDPFRTTMKTSVGYGGGWRVATGVINLGTSSRGSLQYGSTNVLKGLSGLVTEKPTNTLSQKADIKMAKPKVVAKYANLVSFIKSKDAADPTLRPTRR